MIFVIGQSPILHMTALGWHNSKAQKGLFVVRYFSVIRLSRRPVLDYNLLYIIKGV